MELNHADHDARVERILDELDDVEAACIYAGIGSRSISAKNEELAELESERTRLTEGPTA